jgi:thymidylate synthase (FAD)
MTDEYITGHPYQAGFAGGLCQYELNPELAAPGRTPTLCNGRGADHADPGAPVHLIEKYPHEFKTPPEGGNHCAFVVADPVSAGWPPEVIREEQVCGYPESEHHAARKPQPVGSVVRMADVAQYAREPMPDRARAGITVTLIDAPTDPLGTLAVIAGMYEGKVRRSKNEVTDTERRQAYDDMLATVLDGPLEAVQFTFLVEGCDRAFTHQAVRSRFSFFAQESLRFAVAEDWAQEVPLPPALTGRRDDDPVVMVWRRSLNQAEDNYAALVGAGMPAEEARGVLPHAITTRYYWTVSLRTLLQEAGKRTCTQAQFHWRQMFAGVAQALRERGTPANRLPYDSASGAKYDGWQYELFADAIRPVCYQQGKCGFMAKFDRGCTIRERVDAFERAGIPSSEWDRDNEVRVGVDDIYTIGAINPREWAADPAAARVTEEK